MALSIKTLADISKITSSLYKHTAEQIQKFIKKESINVACHQGCDTCCKTMRVEILPPEAFLIAKKIKDDFSKKKIDKLIEKLSISNEKLIGKTLLECIDEHVECVFLENGECSIYNFRPYQCRAFLAKDSTYCLIDQCKTNQVPKLQAELYKHGNIKKYFKTLNESKLDSEPAEISNALWKILTDDTLEARYFNHEKNLFDKLKH